MARPIKNATFPESKTANKKAMQLLQTIQCFSLSKEEGKSEINGGVGAGEEAPLKNTSCC